MITSCQVTIPSERGHEYRPSFVSLFGWLCFYLGAVTVLTWPLAARMGDFLPNSAWACASDLLHIGWVLAHQAQALLPGGPHFADAGIYHPVEGSLYYGQTAIGALPLFAPLYWLGGNPTLALNGLFLGGLALTALCFHQAARWATGSDLAGCAAAATFLLSRWSIFTFVPSVPNYGLIGLFPLLLVRIARPVENLRQSLLLATLLFVQALPDVAYMTVSLFGCVAVVGLLDLLAPTRRSNGRHLLLALAIATLALVPLYAKYAMLAAENPGLAQQTRWTGLGQRETFFPGGFRIAAAPTSIPTLIIPLIVVGAFLATLRFRKSGQDQTSAYWRVGIIFVATSLLLSLTPRIHWFGTPVELPLYGIAEDLGLYERLRVPARMGIGALAGLGVLCGLSVGEILRRRKRRLARGRSLVLGGIAAILLASQTLLGWGDTVGSGRLYRLFDFPLRPAPSASAPLVEALSQGDGPVLELPIDPLKPAWEAEAMYRSIYHGRPLLNGYHGYWPRGHRERAQIANSLPSLQALERIVSETGVRNIVVHQKRLSPESQALWNEVTEAGSPGLFLRTRSLPGTTPWLLFEARSAESTGKIPLARPRDGSAEGD